MARRIDTEDNTRKQLITTILLVGSIVLLSFLIVTHTYNTFKIKEYSGISTYVLPILLLLNIWMYFLARKGRILIPITFTISQYSLGAIYGAYAWGVSMPSSLLLFSLIITISGILVSSRFSIYVSIVIMIMLILLGGREHANPSIASWKSHNITYSDITAYIVILTLGCGLSILSNREIEKALERAHESERSLEQKVEIRTKELKMAQLETLVEISKTAEFGMVAQGLFHDLITPLTSVALYIEELDEPNTKNYIQKAIKATDRMRTMIDLVQSQIKNTGQEENFSAYSEILQVRDLLGYSLRKNRIGLSIHSKEDIHLYGIPLRFSQIIQNITQNSIESFTDEHTREIMITIANPHISISNTGPEITSDKIHKIFEPSYSTKTNHSGIGLATVRHILEKEFKSTIEVTSSPILTTFTITLSHAQDNSTIPR